MNTPEDIRQYRMQQREDFHNALFWFAGGVIAVSIPILLGLILWRVW